MRPPRQSVVPVRCRCCHLRPPLSANLQKFVQYKKEFNDIIVRVVSNMPSFDKLQISPMLTCFVFIVVSIFFF